MIEGFKADILRRVAEEQEKKSQKDQARTGTKPITPAEVSHRVKDTRGADTVIKIFNAYLEFGMSGSEVIVKKRDIIFFLKDEGFNLFQAEEEGWFDIEEEYRDAGWDVERDSGIDDNGQDKGTGITYTFRPRTGSTE